MEESLFKHVFCNIILLRNIYGHVRLFKKNEIVEFKELKSLQEYNEKEYIQSLVYNGDGSQLNEGDLPTSGILKTLEINCNNQLKCNVIPYGVEMITFKFSNHYETPLFSTLPSTVNTLKNVVIIGPGYNGNFELDFEVNDNNNNNNGEHIMDENVEDIKNNNFLNSTEKDYSIPPNITSISFQECPNISGKDGTSLIIPNTIKHLEFDEHWNNNGFKLCVGDIPSSLISLKLGRINFNKGLLPLSNLTKLTIFRELYEFYKLELPNSILELEINCCGSTILDHQDLFNFIPPNVKSLKLTNYKIGVKVISNLHKFKSITTLSVSGCAEQRNSVIDSNSLPPNLTNLTFNIYGNTFSDDSIPNKVRSLTIQARDLDKINKFPNSLKNLKLTDNFMSFGSKYQLENIISKLPTSVKSLSLPTKFNSINVPFPPKIDVKYIDYDLSYLINK